MVGGIVITHGPMAQALIEASEGILGTVTYLLGFSTSAMSRDSIEQEIGNIISSSDWPDETLILVSLKGGSCWNAAVSVMEKYSKIAVVSAVNLPMMLSFLTKRTVQPLSELAANVKNDGIRGIDMFKGTT
ncbi:hypothetical protein JW960_17470 [candidate division KSB1 bacterium]|nr:hypothetical protein [candidate division KSB1 bacterium]